MRAPQRGVRKGLCTPHLQQACAYEESEEDIVEYSRLPPHQQQRGDGETRTAGVADDGTARVIQSPTMRSLALAHPPEGTQLVRKEPKPAVKARRHLSCAPQCRLPIQNCAGVQNGPGKWCCPQVRVRLPVRVAHCVWVHACWYVYRDPIRRARTLARAQCSHAREHEHMHAAI